MSFRIKSIMLTDFNVFQMGKLLSSSAYVIMSRSIVLCVSVLFLCWEKIGIHGNKQSNYSSRNFRLQLNSIQPTSLLIIISLISYIC